MRYARGITLFCLISLASIILIFVWHDISFAFFIESVSEIHVVYILLCFVALCLYMTLDAFRTKYILHGLHQRIGFFDAVSAGVANEFMSALTPFQSGGQPFEIYIMHTKGVPLAHSVIVAYFRMAANVYVLFVASLFIFFYYEDIQSIAYSEFIYAYAVCFMLYFLCITALMIYAPRLAKIITYKTLYVLARLKLMNTSRLHKTLKSALKEIKHFNRYIKQYYYAHHWRIVIICALTACILCSKYLILYVLLSALDVPNAWPQVLSFQALIQFVNYAVPTPGASGSTELFAFNVFELLNSSEAFSQLLPALTVLWRFLSYHTLVILGALNLIRWKKRGM